MKTFFYKLFVERIELQLKVCEGGGGILNKQYERQVFPSREQIESDKNSLGKISFLLLRLTLSLFYF